MLLSWLLVVVIVLCHPDLGKFHTGGLIGLKQNEESNCFSVFLCCFFRITPSFQNILSQDIALSCWIFKVTTFHFHCLKSNIYQVWFFSHYKMLKYYEEVAASVSFTKPSPVFWIYYYKSLCFSRIFSNCLQNILISSFFYSVLLHSRKRKCQLLAELDKH